MSTSVQTLFQQARAAGSLSGASLHALNVADIGEQITAALGMPADDFGSSEAILVTLLIDDSGSIESANNTDLVIEGHNAILDALAGSKQKAGILVSTQYLNGHILAPYTGLDQAVRLSRKNYHANGGTPLYDQSVVVLGTVLAKTQEFAEHGIPVRTITCLVSDGADVHSVRSTAKDVCTVVRDMERSENHIVAAMGLDDGGTDFRQVYREMGVRDQWILTPQNNPTEIRRAFQVFSQSAVQISQGATMGGFAG